MTGGRETQWKAASRELALAVVPQAQGKLIGNLDNPQANDGEPERINEMVGHEKRAMDDPIASAFGGNISRSV